MLLVLDIKLHFSSSDIQIWLLPSSRLPADPQHFARNYGTICQGSNSVSRQKVKVKQQGPFWAWGREQLDVIYIST